MDSKVFDRIEKKYLITKDEKKQLLKTIKKYMQKDSYHKSEVYNIYLDTDNYDLIIQSIDWTDFKHKLRARSYGGYDRVFLEIKTKIRGRDLNPGYKRRVMITRDDFEKFISKESTAQKLAAQSEETTHDRQIAKEVDYLTNYLDLKPKILVMYNRESYKDDDNLRITFDEKLKYRDQNLSFVKAKRDKIYFKDDHNIIMEVKAHGVLPLWLTGLMTNLNIRPQRFSKIGKVYEKIILEKTKGKEQNV